MNYELNSSNLLNWITAFALFEIPMAFFYLSITNKNDTVQDWYSNKTINIWNVMIQDSVYVICGIVITCVLIN